MTTLRRGLAFLMVVAALALLAAACGGDDEPAASITAPNTSTVAPGTTAPSTDTTASTSAATTAVPDTSTAPVTLSLLTHDSFAVSPETLESFTADTGIEVEVIQGGDAGTMVNQAVLTKDNPIADVLFGIDNTFLSRGLEAGLFVPYEAPALVDVPDDLELDPEHRVTPITFGDVCLNYDKEAFLSTGLPVPETLRDLTDPAYRGMLVVEDPATSSPGLAFLAATVARFPEGSDYTWRDFWTDLAANDVRIDSDWETAYYGSFSGGAGEGDRPLVVSYASSPPAEVLFAEAPLDEAPTAVITDGCFRQIEFAGILAGTEHPEAAQQLVDFMLGVDFQEDVPLNMFVFPVNETAELPALFVEHTELPAEPVIGDAAEIDANREAWIETWTDLVR